VERDTLSFIGEQEVRVDPQGRIAVPSRFRDAFTGGLVLTRAYDRCIAAFSHSQWQAHVKEVADLPTQRAKNRRMRRLTFSAAYNLQLDRQGRVMLPATLRQYAGIGESVVVAGMGDYLEVWDVESWQQERELLDQEASYIAEVSEGAR
jgi:MraZ protein